MTIELLLAMLNGVNAAAIIWLCFERDRLHKRIQWLEARV